jgi:hypothetical protein
MSGIPGRRWIRRRGDLEHWWCNSPVGCAVLRGCDAVGAVVGAGRATEATIVRYGVERR